MPIKVAVLGVGEHARRNTLPALNQCNDIELVGMSGRNAEYISTESKKYNCKVYSNADEMLADTQIDVIYIALPVGLHYQWGHRVIQAGKHLWCEKSLTHDPKFTLQLIIEARQKNLSICECFMYVYHPEFEQLRQFMNNKQIGTIKNITAKFGFPHLDSDNIRYNKALGGGALLDVGCYVLHALRQLANGQPDKIHSLLTEEEPYEVDTRGTAQLEFTSGLHAHLEWGFGLSYVNEIELYGDHGRVRATRVFSKPAEFEPIIEIFHTSGYNEELIISPSNHFVSMFNHFAEACINIKLRQTLLDDAEQQSIIMEQVGNN